MTTLKSIPLVLALGATLACVGAAPIARAAPPRATLAGSTLSFRAIAGAGAAADSAVDADTTRQVFEFTPFAAETLATEAGPDAEAEVTLFDDEWLRAPFGDNLLTDPAQWRSAGGKHERTALRADYNRVDRLRLGLGHQLQQPETMMPRLGALIEYAFGRERVLYGLQLEQPLLPPGRLALGFSMARRTDHSELQQVDDTENSLALLLGRQDYRDYFEREGFGAYLSWRVPDFSTVSIHVRNDHFDSLATDRGTRSWLHGERALRANPSVEVGEAHAFTVRLERLAHGTRRTRAGLYHWIEFERAGADLRGDFDYARALGDVRSVVRLTPASTLALRLAGGHTLAGRLPRQKQFTVGGVDGLRAHAFADYRGDQMVLAQAEYVIDLRRLRALAMECGLQAIAFVDAGRAWSNPSHSWDPDRQQIQADGGFGLGTSEDNLRVYFARNLQDPDSDFVISVRLKRPF